MKIFAEAQPDKLKQTWTSIVLPLAVLMLVSVGIGFHVFNFAREAITKNVASDMEAIATIKTEGLLERLRDVEANVQRTAELRISPELKEWLAGGRRNKSLEHQIRGHLQQISDSPYRQMALYSAVDGALLISTTGHPEWPKLAPPIVDAIEKDGLVVDAWTVDGDSSEAASQLDLFFPVSSRNSGKPLAVLHIKADPGGILFPSLRNWPGASRSAEILLVRKDGDKVLYLNTPRHIEKSPQSLRRPLRTPDLVGALAVEGKQGFLEGTDYRGKPVFAYIQPIPGTPWYLIAKEDRREALAHFNAVVALAVVLLGALLSVCTWWLVSRKRMVDALQTSLEESNDLYQNAACGYHSVNNEGIIVRINDTELKMLGYARDELIGKKRAIDLLTPESQGRYRETFFRFTEHGTIDGLEFEFVRKDGTILPILLSSTAVRDKSGRFLMSRTAVYDITARKESERTQLKLNRALRLLSDCNAALIYASGEGSLLDAICRLLVETGGYHMAWVGIPEQGMAEEIKIVSCFGHKEGYLDAAQAICAANGRGEGPTATTIRTGISQVIQDIQGSPDMPAWHEAALQHGFKSNVALPLCDKSVRFGALTIYSTAANAFGADEVKLLEQLAEDLSFGIAALRSTAARKHAEERLQLALDASSEGIVDWNRRNGVAYLSTRCYEISGYRADEVVPDLDFFKNLVHPEDLPAVLDAIHAHLRGETPVAEADYRMVTREGAIRWITGKCRMVERNPDGEAARVVGTISDITARKLANEQLRKLSLAVEQSPESIVITDLQGRIEYVNEAFVRVAGYSRIEVIGQNSRVLQSGKTPRETYAQLWSALTQGKAWSGEFHNRRKDGSEYIEQAIITPIRQSDGRVTHYVAVKEDITEKKLLGLELELHRNHLEELVERRTAELAEAKMAAEAANVAKSAFLANMSHEIRTPMNTIIGLSNLLKRRAPTPEQMDYLDKIGLAADHLLSIIDNILDLSKIEAGKLALESKVFSLPSILEHVRKLVVESARAKGLSIEVDEAVPSLWLRGDPTRLRQALLNYAGNAVKFTQRGGICLSASVVEQGSKSILLRFEVKDTGIGIAADKLAEVFDAFQQADVSTTRKFGGTGLGLTITKRLAQLMGGKAGVESVQGVGSTFWFTARLRRASMPDTSTAKSHEPAQLPLLTGGYLLLVEDDTISQQVAQAILTDAGFTVDLATNGREAVEKAVANEYDLILMDMQMPEMDGIAATKAIRAQPGRARIPIIAVTANAFDEDRQSCLAAGMNDFIAKPVTLDVLVEKFQQWLPWYSKSRDGAPPSPAKATEEPDERELRRRLAEVSGIDMERLTKAVFNKLASLVPFLQRFAQNHERELGALRDCITARDFAEARRLAHSIQGVAAFFGFTRVQTLAADMETQIRQGCSIEELERLVAQLEGEQASLISALLEILAGYPTPA